jgi:hypothetical protein
LFGFSSAIELAVDCLEAFPDVPVHREGHTLWVPARDDTGFTVAIVERSQRITVYHSRWHQVFGDGREAFKCFLFGLTAAERLKVVTRGNCDCRWDVETNVAGAWASIGSVVWLLFPYWRKRRIRYLQNDWIDVARLREWVDDRFTADRLTKPGYAEQRCQIPQDELEGNLTRTGPAGA